MLRKLVLHKVGPAEHLALDPVAPRLNLITGDNGLGKSFLLDAAWSVLTRTWHDTIAVPTAPDAKIEQHFDGVWGISQEPSTWEPVGQHWKRTQGRPTNPGLSLRRLQQESLFVANELARQGRLNLRDTA